MKIQAPSAYARIPERNMSIEPPTMRKSVANQNFPNASSVKDKSGVEANPPAPSPVLGSHIDLRV